MNVLWFLAGFILGIGVGAVGIFFYIKYTMKKMMKSFDSLDVLMNILQKHEKKKNN